MNGLLLAQEASVDLRGFLPTRGSFMLDFVFVAMFGIIPVLLWSIWLVRTRKPDEQWKCELHKRVQIGLAAVLLVAVTAFEVDMQLISKDWRPMAEASPYYASKVVDYSLWIHLAFAIPTPLLWIFVIVQAIRRFPSPAAPSEYSSKHVCWARLAAAGMCLTAVTGWIFYYVGFVA